MRSSLVRLVLMSLCALGTAGLHAAEPLQASDFAGVFPLANVNEGLNALELTGKKLDEVKVVFFRRRCCGTPQRGD